MHKRILSFKYAIKGIVLCYKQPNMIIHAIAAIIVVVSGVWLHFSILEWGAIILTIGAVTVAEAFNTAIEKLVDLVSPEKNKLAGQVKDIAAGAVLIAAIMAIAMALIIILPKILTYFR